MIKGLDDYITGKNDPDAPFNQVDWTDTMSDVLDNCDEITEEVYDKEWEFIEVALEETFTNAVKESVTGNKYLKQRDMYQFVKDNQYLMTVEFRKRYKILKFWDTLSNNPKENPITFNAMCFEQAKLIGIDEGLMNRIISIWGCTSKKEFPVNYFKTLLK